MINQLLRKSFRSTMNGATGRSEAASAKMVCLKDHLSLDAHIRTSPQ